MKTVKVARVGSKVQEVAVRIEATIEECLEAANIQLGANEDVYENHVKRCIGTNALIGSTLVVEPQKIVPLSSKVMGIIDILSEEECIDADDYYDDYDNTDYNWIYSEYGKMINDIIKVAREG